MRTITKMTIPEFLKKVREQDVPIADATFRCPACGTLQSANDLIKAGAGKDFNEVEGYLGFSCIGRFNERKTGCDWTLGGLLQIHELSVIDKKGVGHPRFMPVESEEAKKKREAKKKK